MKLRINVLEINVLYNETSKQYTFFELKERIN